MYRMMLILILVFIALPTAFCQENIQCPKLSVENYPALLFTKGNQLNIAYWNQDDFKVEEIFYGSYVNVQRVGKHKFVVSGSDFSQ